MPIGTEELISNFPYKELRQFHSDWYRPDLQAVIIVGDIDVAQMESEVKRLFSDLKSPQHPKPRVEHKIPLLHTNQFIAVTDPEMTSTQVQIIIKHPKRELKTLGDYRDALLKNVYSRMINSRLSELAQRANPPFLGASVAVGGFMDGLDSYTASVSVKSGELEGGFKAMLRELERAHQHGFLESEFQRAISVLNKSNEAGYVERDKRESASYVKGYLVHFLDDAPALSSEDSYRLTKQLLPGLTLAEVEAIGKKYYVDTNRDIVVLAPEKDKPSLPNEQLASAWFKTVEGEQLAAYVDNTSDLPMLAVQPQAGSVVSSKTLEDIEAKELTLSNGVKVILKSTTFKNDQIILNAFSPGGTSLVSDEDFYSATHAGVLVNMSGVGQMNSVELQKFMTGKRFNIQPYIGERSEGLSGSSDKEGLPLMFEMLHAYFTAPRIDKDVFDNAISNAIAQMANRDSDPNFTFSKAVMALTYNNHLRRTPVEPEDMKKIDREHTLAIYKERFADASDFVFTIVGSFTEAEITPYLEQYVASLPSLARAEEAKDLGIYETDKGLEHKVYKGKEPKAYVSMAYYGDFTYNDQEVMNLNALQSVLNVKLLEQLREEEGGTYGVGARVTTTKYPKGRFGLTITFGTGVEKYEALSKSAMDVLHKVVNEGPSQEDLDKFKIEQRRQIELAFKENGFWLGQISSSYQQHEDPAYVVNQLDKDLDNLTVESVQAVAKKYLKDEKIVKSVLLPE